MSKVISRIDFEKNMIQLATHGVSDEKLRELRDKFEKENSIPKDDSGALDKLRTMGFSYNRRKTTTKIIKDKK